jgi:PTS system ascorbate-specific IIA component
VVVSTVPVRAAHAEQVEDWREAVRTAAGLLVDLGVADAAYVEACVASVEKNGPYIVLTKGVALAHAQVEVGVTSEGIGLLRLAEPVAFGHPANDPVDLVFAFSTSGGDAHLAMIRRFGLALGGDLPARAREAEPDRLEDVLCAVAADD